MALNRLPILKAATVCALLAPAALWAGRLDAADVTYTLASTDDLQIVGGAPSAVATGQVKIGGGQLAVGSQVGVGGLPFAGTRLNIAASSAANNSVAFSDSAAGGQTWLLGPGTGTGSPAAFSLYNATNSSTLMTVTTNGFVGIGTTVPVRNLHVKSASNVGVSLDITTANPATGVANIELRNSNTTVGNATGIEFLNAGTAPSAFISGVNYNHNTNGTQTGGLDFSVFNAGAVSHALTIAPDGSVVANGSGAGALRVGTAPTDNRTNTQLQVLGSMAAYANSDSSEADVFAADLNYFNNGTPTWAGAGAIWYGKTRSGNLFSTTIPLARMALFLGQNSATTAFGANTNNPVYFVNSTGVGFRLNPNLSTSFFGNATTLPATGEVQIGGGQIATSGNVTVGSSTANANLAVIGIITSKEIKVTTSGADYVFEDGYRLRPLAEVEQFVQREKHLPEIMTAKDMQTAGMPVSEVVTKQLAKIEELTLYAIQQEKVIEAQRHDQVELRRVNAALLEHQREADRRIDALEARTNAK